MYLSLQNFKQENGHCRVPQTFGELGKWTKLQRKKFKQQKVPQDRIDKLNALGFLWTVTTTVEPESVDVLRTEGDCQGNSNASMPLRFVPGLQKEGLWREKHEQLKAVCDSLLGVSNDADLQNQQKHQANPGIKQQEDDRKPAAVGADVSNVKTTPSQQMSHSSSPTIIIPSFAMSHNLMTILKEQHPTLHKWLQEQRKKRQNGKLTKSCTMMLHQCFHNSPIWMVEPAWLKMYQSLLAYATQHGSCQVLCSKPNSNTISTNTLMTIAGKAIPRKHRVLYEWVQQQRSFDNLLNLQSAMVDPSPDSLPADPISSNTTPPLTLEQAEWLQNVPGWSWETGDAENEDDDEFGAYFVQLKRLQIDQQADAFQGEGEDENTRPDAKRNDVSITECGAIKINVRKSGKLGKFVQLQQKLHKEQYPGGHDALFADTDSTVKGIESLAAAAETVEAAAVGEKRKEPPTANGVDVADATLFALEQQEHSKDSAAITPALAKKVKLGDGEHDLEEAAAQAAQNAATSANTIDEVNEDATARKQKSTPAKLALTKRKIQLLDSIGFSWNLANVQHSWEDMFGQLKDYKNEHGDCLVAKRYKRNPKLGMWVGKQRDRYKKMICLQNGGDDAMKKSQKKYWDSVTPLTQEQLDLLNGIGFVWQAGGPDIIKSDWQSMFEKLKEYREQHGTCNVSQKAAGKLGRLGRWVKTQREKYHGSKVNLSPLTPEQKKQLESIGFEWRPGGSRTHDETWQTMFNELKAFRDEHGNCKVPQKKGKLGGWVDRQRKRFRATQQAREFIGKPENQGRKPPSLLHNTAMTDDQIQALNAIGFVWQLRDRSKADDTIGILDGAGHQEFNPLDGHDTIRMEEDPYHQHHSHAMEQHYQNSQHAQPHHGGHVMMLNAPEDEAATRSLLYFQGGAAAAAGIGGGNADMGYGVQQPQYNYTMQQSYNFHKEAVIYGHTENLQDSPGNVLQHHGGGQGYSTNSQPTPAGYLPNNEYDSQYHPHPHGEEI
jgi:hypothetical protein